MIINKEEIIKLLPHREPFLFLDKCEIIEIGKKGIGYRKFLPSEYFFTGHFPNMPITPGIFIIEALAQTASVLVMHSLNLVFENKLVYFMSIENAKFRKPVFPNSILHLNVKKKQHRELVWKFSGEAKVGNQKVADAIFSAMIIK